MTRLIIISITGLLLSCKPLPDPQKTDVKQSPKNVKVVRILKGSIEGVTFYDEAFTFSWHYVKNSDHQVTKWIGGDGDKPSYVVKSLSLNIGGKNVDIPSEAYNDFCDPPVYSKPTIMTTKNDFYIHFSLSDGAGSCKVTLNFKNNLYIGRTIQPHSPI